MKLRKILAALAATITTTTISTSLVTPLTINNMEQAVVSAAREAKAKNEISLSSTDSQKIADHNIAKYSLIETRTFEDEINKHHEKVDFDDTKLGIDLEHVAFEQPSLSVKNNNTTLTFDRKYTRNFNLICEKIRVDVTVPAHSQNRMFKTFIGMNSSNFIDEISTSTKKDNFSQTAEYFDLGENPDLNPEFFIDSNLKNQKTNVDKTHVSSNIVKSNNIKGNGEFKDYGLNEITYFYDNPSDEPITKSRYIMISYLSDGVSNEEASVKNKTEFEISTSCLEFNFSSTTGVRLNNKPDKFNGLPIMCRLVLPKGKTKITEFSVTYRDAYDTLYITNDCNLSFNECNEAILMIPNLYSNANIDVKIEVKANNSMNIEEILPQSVKKHSQVAYTDGQDLSINYMTDINKGFGAHVTGKKYNSKEFTEIFSNVTKVGIDTNKNKEIWNLRVASSELSSIENLKIEGYEGIKLVSQSQANFEALDKETKTRLENNLHGWDFEPGQWSDYCDWCNKLINNIIDELKKQGKPVDYKEIQKLQKWLQDNGKIVYPQVVDEMQRRDRWTVKKSQKNSTKNDFQTVISTNGKPLYFVDRDFTGSTIPYSKFFTEQGLSNKNAITFNFNQSGQFEINGDYNKSSRYIYIPFKVTLSVETAIKTLFYVFPSFFFELNQNCNYKAGHGYNGNFYMSELFYFGNTAQSSNLTPTSFTNVFDAAPNKLDDKAVWKQNFYGEGKSSSTTKFQMIDVLDEMSTLISNGKPQTLYFGLYFACKSRPSKYGESKFSLRVTPHFDDKNSVLGLGTGMNEWLKPKQFERDSSLNDKRTEFKLSELQNDKQLKLNDVKRSANGFVVPEGSRNNNIRGIYLPTFVNVKLPAHSKANAKLGMAVESDIYRNHYLSAWETSIKSFPTYHKLYYPSLGKDVDDAKNLVLPFDDKYYDEYSKLSEDDKNSLKNNTVASMPNKPNSLKIKADAWEIAAIAIQVAATVLTISLSIYSIVMDIADSATYQAAFLAEEFNELKDAEADFFSEFLTGAFKFWTRKLPDMLIWGDMAAQEAVGITITSFIELFGGLALGTATALSVAKMEHLRNKKDLIGSFDSSENEIYNVTLVNDTDEEKIFTYDMAYSCIYKGNRGRENDLAYSYAAYSNINITDFEYTSK